ncbi:bacterio-opsin activator [Halovenus sp. WSH3]|uniref:Bacterio-opsin activator n=1 Tax=Halovenus carboxidivorans TaxID=2692199 RepID=A0A6B0T9T6_9EURY|nr:helix-turn-helix domain-containing protein [Halovenus carboxidivorans]MXR52333.1 bacterio-opsin activator [Halovenus carboxidivorans]
MPYAKLSITVPEDVWLSELSQEFPAVRFRVLAATANDETGVARLELSGPNVGAVCEQMESYDAVTNMIVSARESERRRLQVETTVPVLMNAVQTAGVPLDLPVEIEDGVFELETTVPQEKLSRLGETLDSLGISYTVERIQQETESEEPLLTDRQEWLLREAIERGYYDTPRRITLVELAEQAGIAKSTCSEILHRAEGQVLKEFLEDERQGRSEVSITAD